LNHFSSRPFVQSFCTLHLPRLRDLCFDLETCSVLLCAFIQACPRSTLSLKFVAVSVDHSSMKPSRQFSSTAARAPVVITPVREIAARPAPLPSSLRLRIPRRRLPEHPPQPVAVLVSAQFVLACRCMPSQLALTLDMWPTRPRQLWKVTRNSKCNVRK